MFIMSFFDGLSRIHLNIIHNMSEKFSNYKFNKNKDFKRIYLHQPST